MTPGDEPSIRTATHEDFDAIWDLLSRAFLSDPVAGQVDRRRGTFEPDRDLMITDGDLVIANVGAYTRDLTVPGAIVPAAHVTEVSVHPTHRRRGHLRRLMEKQLRE